MDDTKRQTVRLYETLARMVGPDELTTTRLACIAEGPMCEACSVFRDETGEEDDPIAECGECPIAKRTGQAYCLGTPRERAENSKTKEELLSALRDMVRFVKETPFEA
jgi:hypothetical protein